MSKYLFFIILLILPATLLAQTGKIVGQVIDQQTGEPLVGANVLLEGTYLGGATDINGEYIILNVPPATYDIKGLYVGYRDYIIQNIKINANLTTSLDLEMTTDALESETIVVVAVKPLINKNITNSNSVVTAKDIENLPIRGVANVVSQQAGVVSRDGNIYVRGSRADGVAYYVDGILVNNPVFGGAQTSLIQNSIEEIQFQAGGYSAEFGGANGGIVSTHSKIGSDKYKFNAELISDNFAGAGESYFGGYSYGYSEYILSASGPVIPGNKKLKFFLAGNNLYTRSPQEYFQGVDFKNVKDPRPEFADDEPFDFYYPDGYSVNEASNAFNINGNLTLDLSPISLRANVSHLYRERRLGIGMNNYNSRSQAGLQEEHTFTTSLKMTHIINPTNFYDLIVNYVNDFEVEMDPTFKHDIFAYGDSLSNAAVGFDMDADSNRPNNLTAYNVLSIAPSPRVYDEYRKTNYQQIGGKFNFLSQMTKNHEVKLGVEASTYKIRRYYHSSPVTIAANARSTGDGSLGTIFPRIDNYGYDELGNEINSGTYNAKKPVFAGVYLQDKIEYSDLIINAGVRFDYIDIDGKKFRDPSIVPFTPEGRIDLEQMDDVKPFQFVSPRLGFSFPVTETTVFHAQYGKFIQQSRLRDVYLGVSSTSDQIKGGFAIQNPVGYGIKPERTTQSEIGFKKQLGEFFAFDLTMFYKDIKDQIQIRQQTAGIGAEHRAYYVFQNGDFSTTKGLELKLDLRRTNRISAQVDYTLSSAQGTGSTPNDAFRQIWQAPPGTNGDEPFFALQISPLSFNQTHKGSFNLDYRFTDDDGPEIFGSKALSNFGANFLLTFNSGTNYTRIDGFEGIDNDLTPIEPLNNSQTPWVFDLNARFDKTFKIGPLNVNAYVWIINLLDRKNVLNVFRTTGDPEDDGWLTAEGGLNNSEVFSSYSEKDAETYRALYNAWNYDEENFGTPQQVRFGLRLDF